MQFIAYQTIEASGVGVRTVAIASAGLLIMVCLAALSQHFGQAAKRLIFVMLMAVIVSTTLILIGDALSNSQPRTNLGIIKEFRA